MILLLFSGYVILTQLVGLPYRTVYIGQITTVRIINEAIIRFIECISMKYFPSGTLNLPSLLYAGSLPPNNVEALSDVSTML